MNYFELFKPIDPASAVNDTRFEKEFQTFPHSSYEWERLYCSFVRNGDVEGARRFMKQLLENGKSITVGNVSQNELNQTKYLAVSMIAVLTRVAINSGADELKTYQVSDTYLQSLDNLISPEEIVSHMFYTVDIMIQAVRDAKNISENSAYFNRCREYISAHLGEKISVTKLAEICGLTPNYLSALFKKISGKTITDYILEQRITAAKQLLLSGEYTTDEIATFLGFHSQSYFIERFKKQVGMTPRAWKITHGKNAGVDLYPGI